jgi:hypothetical protein
MVPNRGTGLCSPVASDPRLSMAASLRKNRRPPAVARAVVSLGCGWARMTPMRRRLNVVLLGLGLVIALAACGHTGGDPNNGVSQLLKRTSVAVPISSSNVIVRSTSSSWVLPCPEFVHAQAGWSAAETRINFTDSSPSADVVDHVDSSLRGLGWRRHDIINTPGQGKIAHWTLNIKSGGKAQAFAFQAPPHSGDWFVNSSWQPPGPKAEGCP